MSATDCCDMAATAASYCKPSSRSGTWYGSSGRMGAAGAAILTFGGGPTNAAGAPPSFTGEKRPWLTAGILKPVAVVARAIAGLAARNGSQGSLDMAHWWPWLADS